MANNNGIALVVLALLGFLAIIITGKFILDKKNETVMINQPIPQPIQPTPVEMPQQSTIQPDTSNQNNHNHRQCPESYHKKSEFWMGYNDAWARMPARLDCLEYRKGYEIGRQDRRANYRDYYHRHYPPGFHIRVPGIRLDIH